MEPNSLIGLHVRHMRRRGLADGTIDKRRSRLSRFDAAAGLATAEPEDVEVFLDNRRGRDGRLSKKARYGWISDLHQFYRWAIDHGHLDQDPTRRVIRPKVQPGLPRPISTGDLMTALDMAEPTMRSWLSLMAFGGLRCAEVASLDVDGLLWEDSLIRVVGKFDKPRLVPMHDEVARTLRAVSIPSRGRVFRRPRGGPYPAAQVSREVSLYFESLGIGATAHQLRHWFGTHVQRIVKDLRVTQELMGHANPATTAIYAKWSQQEGRRAVDALSLSVDPTLFTEWADGLGSAP